MSLSTEVQARYSAQILINASNPQLASGGTLDTARLGYACTDVQAEFSKRGITFDVTDATHLATAVPGVLARLIQMTQADDSGWKTFKDDVKFLAETTSRDRILPYTNSPLQPTPDPTDGVPFADNTKFDRYTPSPDSQQAGQD